MKEKLTSKKTIILFFAPFLIALIVVGFIFSIKANKIDNPQSQPLTDVDYTYTRLYLADCSNTLLPLTIKYETFENKSEELLHIVNMLKKDSEVTNSSFNGLLPSDTLVLSMDLKDENLNINFSSSFKNYDSKDELRILESLVWTFTDLDYVKSISLSMENNLLTNMPVNNTPISSSLDKNIGINKYLLTNSILSQGEMVLSYYEKVINDKYYYVPVTHYVKNENNLSIYDLTITTLFKDPGITSSLSVCKALSDTYMVNNCIVTDNILYVSLSEDILYDETTVSLEVYQLIKECSVLLDDVTDVSFLMELEEVLVNGLEDESQEVSKIELNKFYI